MRYAICDMRMSRLSPVLNAPRSADDWLALPGAPKAERPPEDPITVSYDELLFQWQTERDR